MLFEADYAKNYASIMYQCLSVMMSCTIVERERERERDACDVIDITLKSRVIMHMITSTARGPSRRRVLSLSSARTSTCMLCRQGAWRLSARLSSRVE